MMSRVIHTESFNKAGGCRDRQRFPRATSPRRCGGNLPVGQDIFFRVRFRDLSHRNLARAMVGLAAAPPNADRARCQLRLGGRFAGRLGSLPRWRMVTFDTMASTGGFLPASGDTLCPRRPFPLGEIADGKSGDRHIPKGKSRPNARRVRPRKSFPGRDCARFNAEVAVFVQWTITGDEHCRRRRTFRRQRWLRHLPARAARPGVPRDVPMRPKHRRRGRVYRTLARPHLDVAIWTAQLRGPNGPTCRHTARQLFIGPDHSLADARPVELARPPKVIASDCSSLIVR